MFSIFNIKKPNTSVPNVPIAVDDLSRFKREKHIDDLGLLVVVSSEVNDLDLGDFDSGLRRPIHKVSILLIFVLGISVILLVLILIPDASNFLRLIIQMTSCTILIAFYIVYLEFSQK